MAVKGVIFDLDDTLLAKGTGKPMAGVPEMIRQLEKLGIRWAVTSNNGSNRAKRLLTAAGLTPTAYATLSEVGQRKPAPAVCTYAAKELGLALHELVYVGDDARTDAICAINSRVLYLHAGWANTPYAYGLRTATPAGVTGTISAFLRRSPRWFWTVDSRDALDAPVRVRAMLSAASAWNTDLARRVRDFLKQGSQADIGTGMKFGDFLMLYFLTTLYLDGLHHNIDRWAAIPGHGVHSTVTMLQRYAGFASKLFKDRFWGDLLVRHRNANKAAFARYKGLDPGFVNQVNTLHLNPAYQEKLRGKRVAVVDDFTTQGYSFECARNLLLRGGAVDVTCFSIGRYPSTYLIQTVKGGKNWNPWAPAAFLDTDFKAVATAGDTDVQALNDFVGLVKSLR